MLFYGFFGTAFFQQAESSGLIKLGEMIKAYDEVQGVLIKKFIKMLQKSQKPVLLSSLLGRRDNVVAAIQDQGFPVYYFPETAVDAMKAIWEYSKYRIKAAQTDPQ
jgi:acyl-CoA synthetase (NDP forming)